MISFSALEGSSRFTSMQARSAWTWSLESLRALAARNLALTVFFMKYSQRAYSQRQRAVHLPPLSLILSHWLIASWKISRAYS